MLVIAYGITRGARRATWATLGILSANALYFALSATALGAVLVSSSIFFTAIKWAGAAYLIYIGLMALLSRPSPITLSGAAARGHSAGAIFLSGLGIQLANPKMLVFFVAILPQFVDPQLAVGPQMLWLAVGSIIPEFFILAGYAALAARARGVASDPRYAQWTERIAGVFMLAIAALVLTVAPG
jgi:threonine/homoserine/homoserine lactone efflux protein